ncbi:MAG: PSD1 and planctomycete cytochrome C domain-containing protein [Verrucomicrobiota bacterium]
MNLLLLSTRKAALLFRLLVSQVLYLSVAMAAEVDFAHEVVPVLEKHCVECHGGEKSKGGLSMNTRALLLEADVLEPGDPDASLMIELLTVEGPDERMPPPKNKKVALNEKEIDVLKRWIAADVPWVEGFTFAEDRYEPPLRPRQVTLPPGPEGANPIDLIVAEHFKDKELEAPAPADDATFLRRVSEDLTGLPPSEELRGLLSGGKPLDRDAAVDRLLSDKQGYAEHWMTFWNDLLRNDYSGTGYIEGGRKQVTAWLYPALLENKAFDEFVRDLVAPTEASRGFIDGIKWRGVVNASQTTQIQFSQNISQVFLGINMKCASCHDSFIDRWTLREAYDLAAIYSETPLELTRCDKPTGEMAKPAWLFPELGQIDASKPRDERLKQLADLMTHPENGRMQRTIVNRLWAAMMGRGIVHPVDSMNTQPWNEDLLDLLANRLVSSGYDLKAVLRLIATSRIYQAQSEVREDENAEYVFRGPIRKRMTAEQFLDTIRSVTGVWPMAKGKPVRSVMGKRDTLQAALGRPNRDQVVTSRPDSVTTLEAINLSNGPELAGLIREGAEKLHKNTNLKGMVRGVVRSSLSRDPSTEEMRIAGILLGDKPAVVDIEDFLWTVFMLPEFHYIN